MARRVQGLSRAGALGALAWAVLIPGLAFSHDQPDSHDAQRVRNMQPFPDETGAFATFSTQGRIDTGSAFFQSLGTNGRSCATCHAPNEAYTINPPAIRERFERTKGRDPLFASVDGANCTNASRSDRAAHSLLLNHGLIRVGITLPANAEFTISVVHDPYGCALTTDAKTGGLVASVYRRPLPSANLGFLSTVMWDGRETTKPLNDGSSFLENLRANLTQQAIDATAGHAEGVKQPTRRQLAEIVDFELSLYTAQIWDGAAGALGRRGAQGGPWPLANQLYYPGVNDPLGGEPNGLSFNSSAMTLFTAWAKRNGDDDADDMPAELRAQGWRPLARNYRTRADARRDIAAGEKLFNTAPLTISGVRGLNDNAALGKPAAIVGTCTTCHDAPNVGNHSLPLPLDIGVVHTARGSLENDPLIAAALDQVGEPNLPVFEIKGCSNPFAGGQVVSFFTTDPGKALISGACSDVNRTKGPVLRALATRAPYFHNGAAATLLQAVNFYDQRFQMKLTDDQKRQLVAFLNSL